MIFTVAWWNNFSKFVADSPIHLLAASIRATGCREKIILLINDVNKLPEDYYLLLNSLDVKIVNVDQMTSIITSGYPALASLNFYEMACFVRWLFIERYLRQYDERAKDVLIVDGDVLFLVSPGLLRQAFSGRTFVLQGCPAITFLSEPLEWLDEYLQSFGVFGRSPKAVSEALAIDKE